MANERFQNALKGKVQNIPPVWMMRQAGRYHSHYRALREKHGFKELCMLPDVAAEVAMGPIEEFDFDLAILFSDILFPLEALGMPLEYSPGPKMGFHVNDETIKSLKSSDEAIGALAFQKEAVAATRERLPDDKSLIGFVGGPWTLFSYAVQGTHAGGLLETKKHLHLWPEFAEKINALLHMNIEQQLEAGAEAVMVLDTAAGELSPDLFRSLVQPGLEQIAKRKPNQLGYYAKSITADFFGDSWREIPWAGQGFDHRMNIRPYLGGDKFVQGNFDQLLLHQDPKSFEANLREYLKPFAEMSPEQRKGWVCGVGHGLVPKTPEENVKRFVQVIREVFA